MLLEIEINNVIKERFSRLAAPAQIFPACREGGKTFFTHPLCVLNGKSEIQSLVPLLPTRYYIRLV
jgi:hypothetical protein